MKKITCLLLACVVLFGLASCIAPAEPTQPEQPTILVALADTEGLTVLSDNPIRIRSGEDAVFRVEVQVGYRFVDEDGIILSDNGRLTVQDVLYPSTITVECTPVDAYTVTVAPDRPGLGTVTVGGRSSRRIKPGDAASLSAVPADGAAFLGYSLDRPLSLGGAFLSGDADYSFVCTDDLEIIANFAAADPAPAADPARTQRVVYHACGGSIFGRFDSFTCDYEDDYYYFPNTLPDLGYFTRAGYVLAGYSTAPDESGTFVGCGWNALTNEQGTAELYAVWLPVTPDDCFTFVPDEENGGLTVTSCTSQDRTVVIPETHDGTPVTGIAAGAFNHCLCETLMITRNVRTVADGAITDCPQLTRLIFSDGVVSISDACIRDCPSFSTLSMHAVMMPRYCDDREGTYAIKYEHLRASADLQKLMVVAGSNCAYGLDSTVLYDALEDYDVINYGCNSYAPALFFLEACLPYFNEGDILLLCPEDNDFQFGRGETRPYIWHFFEAAYEAFEYVDQRHFVNTFTSFAEFNQTRMNMKPKTYQDKTRETTNRFGDYCAHKDQSMTSFDPYVVPNKTYFHVNNVTRYADRMNEALDKYHALGARVWMSWSVVNENWLEPDSQPGGEDYNRYVEAVRDKIHAAVISDMADYVMAPDYFYNSHQHLTTEGTAIRTERLLRDIERQLGKED